MTTMPGSVASETSTTASSVGSLVLSSDAEPPIAFATRYPAVKKGKGAEARVAVRNRNAAVRVLDFMLKNEDKCVDIWGFCESLQTEAGGAAVAEYFSDQYRKAPIVPICRHHRA